MATSEVEYPGELSTVAVHLRSSSKLTTDAPIDNNGLGRTFSPTDLLATSLVSCMLTIMGIRANDLLIDITGTKAQMTKLMTSNPRRVAEIQVELSVVDNGLSKFQKGVLEKAALTCPVALSLNEKIIQTVSFKYKKK